MAGIWGGTEECSGEWKMGGRGARCSVLGDKTTRPVLRVEILQDVTNTDINN